jgi:hypothetical protein
MLTPSETILHAILHGIAGAGSRQRGQAATSDKSALFVDGQRAATFHRRAQTSTLIIWLYWVTASYFAACVE